MSKGQTKKSFLNIIILNLKNNDNWKARANFKINNAVIPVMKVHKVSMNDKFAI